MSKKKYPKEGEVFYSYRIDSISTVISTTTWCGDPRDKQAFDEGRGFTKRSSVERASEAARRQLTTIVKQFFKEKK